jgi:hypothetical protein
MLPRLACQNDVVKVTVVNGMLSASLHMLIDRHDVASEIEISQVG